jgi:hypothetical protein
MLFIFSQNSVGGTMFTTLKKAMFAFVLVLMVVSTGAWQSSSTALAADGGPETPLAPGVNWNDLGPSIRDIQLNIKGDALELSGETFQAGEKFVGGVPQEVTNFYSNTELYKSGWSSDNAFEDSAGTHRIFYHDSGYYLAIEYLKCADDANSTCVTVWKSVLKDTAKLIPGKQTPSTGEMSASAVFGKITPLNDSLAINPNTVYLSWSTYAPALKYSYCVKAWSACAANDPNWTGTFLNTSIYIGGLSLSTVYFWQVKAITNMDTLPKEYVLADNATPWKFTATASTVLIYGYTGVSGVTLKYVDTNLKSVVSGTNGYYAFTVPLHWSGTVTPTKPGVVFAPASRTYTNVLLNQPSQNYAATVTRYTISGKAGMPGTLLSYVDVTSKTVIADSLGNYTFTVPYNWTGKVTPTRVGVASFVPAYINYTYVKSNFPNQNYQANRVTGFMPMGMYDGFVLETSQGSGVGGSVNSIGQTLLVGDSAQNQQYRSMLSYNTGALPDNAVIVSAKLKLKMQSTVGSNPLGSAYYGLLVIDMTKYYFGASPMVGPDDFDAPAQLELAGYVGKTPVGGYYVGPLSPTAFTYLNKTGLTQFRLEFQTNNNNNNVADYAAFFSGNAVTSSNRPILEIIYYVP